MLRRILYARLLRRTQGLLGAQGEGEGEGAPGTGGGGGSGGGGGGGGALAQLRAKAAAEPPGLEGVDMEGDNALNAGELETMLRQTRLSEHFTVKELMARFDED